MTSRITPVILAGGAGLRLWPVSQHSMPKQFVELLPDRRSTFQAALDYASSKIFDTPIVMTREEYRWIAAEQARAMRREPEIVLEPTPCGTALAVAISAHIVRERRSGSLCLILASDHILQDHAQFEEDCRAAAEVAAKAHIVTFGIAPRHPNPDYGYIETGEVLSGGKGCRVTRFVEKPDRIDAERLIDSGCLWNSGNLLFDPTAMMHELEAITPSLATTARYAFDNVVDDGTALILPKHAGQGLNAISLDYALLEKTSRAAVVHASFGWSDIGSWDSIFNLGAKDPAGNVIVGEAHALDTGDSLVFSDGPVAAVIGLKDVAVVATPDKVLVSKLEQSSKIKEFLSRLEGSGQVDAPTMQRVNRPWGWFARLGGGSNFQVKQISVRPGAALSLQMHYHRAEHWTVVQGIGEITIGTETNTFAAGSNVYIARETVHRLRNAADTELIVIEVQTGSYLGEDDIVRFEDLYQRI